MTRRKWPDMVLGDGTPLTKGAWNLYHLRVESHDYLASRYAKSWLRLFNVESVVLPAEWKGVVRRLSRSLQLHSAGRTKSYSFQDLFATLEAAYREGERRTESYRQAMIVREAYEAAGG